MSKRAEVAHIPDKLIEKLEKHRGYLEAAEIAPADGPPVELFGNVILVEGYDLPSYWGSGTFKGCHALVSLRDQPGEVVAVITEAHQLQTLLEQALATEHQIAFWGRLLGSPPTPLGGTWAVPVYGIWAVILYGWV